MNLEQRYAKTEAGRAEIKTRALGLNRTARNLLLVLDGTRTALDWLVMVQGAEEEHLAALIDSNLIAPLEAAQPVAAVAPPQPAARVSTTGFTLLQIFGESPQLNYEQLASLLSSQAPKQLGLIKGYGMALDVEKCATLADLQMLAMTFIERVASSKGEDAARQMRLLIGVRI